MSTLQNGRGTVRRLPETEFVLAAASSIGLVALCALPLAGALAGTAGLAGAAAGVGLLALLFGLSAVLHVAAAGLRPQLWMAVTVAGFGLRLLLYFAALRGIAGVDGLSTLALALTAAAGILVGQVFEMRALTRSRSGAYIGHPPRYSSQGVDR